MPSLTPHPKNMPSLTLHRLRRALPVAILLTITGSGVADAAYLPPIYMNNGQQSAERVIGNCYYRFQVGQYGSAAYFQVKLRGRCVDAGMTGTYARVHWARNATTGFTSAYARHMGVTQATERDAIATGGGFRVCGRVNGRVVCTTRTVKLRRPPGGGVGGAVG